MRAFDDRAGLPSRRSCVGHAGALFLALSALPALAHDDTLHAHEATRDRAESRLLAAGFALRALIAPLPDNAPACQLTIKLLDEETQRPMSGLVRVALANGNVVSLPGLVNRALGLRPDHPGREWFVLPESGTVPLPREELRIESVAGLETERSGQTLDLRGKERAEVTVALRRFAEPARKGWRSGNTHLHLRGMSRAQSDEYLRCIPRADGLEILFVSFLLRANQDAGYITNSYTPGEVRALSGGGLQFGWGEEHRNDFAHGEGYGHVMLLNLRRLIEPVSIGPGIAGAGFDFPPLRRGIDEARREGGTVLWCHNANGFEDVPNWLAGRIHAHNIFDGGNRGDYADTYYRFLNVGLKVPFSTGTDWFIYDFSRVYARMDGALTEQSWLDALIAGRTFISNGPLLELRADDHDIGDTIRLDRERIIAVHGRAAGRGDFGKIELIHNGAVIAQASSRGRGGHFEAELKFPLPVKAAGWIALRVPPRAPKVDPVPGTAPVLAPRAVTGPRNEMDEPLFAHTSPVYLEFKDGRVFLAEAARALIADLEKAERDIGSGGKFADAAQRDEVLALYREGVASLRRRMQE